MNESTWTRQWHVVWSTQGRQPIAPDEARRRALARVIVERAGPVLVLFCVVDDHVHVWLIGDEATRSTVVRRLTFGIAGAAAVPLQPAHIEPVDRRSHAASLIPYVLTQLQHHGIDVHPAAWGGSCLADVLGARDISGWTSRLGDAVPRTRISEIHRIVGLPLVKLEPASDDLVRGLGGENLLSAAAAAFAAPPDLSGRRPEVLQALTAAAQLARGVGIPASALPVRARETISRCANRPISERALRVLRMRITLDQAAKGCTVPWRPGHAQDPAQGVTDLPRWKSMSGDASQGV